MKDKKITIDINMHVEDCYSGMSHVEDLLVIYMDSKRKLIDGTVGIVFDNAICCTRNENKAIRLTRPKIKGARSWIYKHFDE